MQEKTKVYFRADASDSIGYGHFVRTLALADMLKDDFNCSFFTQSPNDFQKREVGKVCKLEELPSDNTRFEAFLNLLKGDEIVVLDNYFYSSDYEKAIKEKGCKLVSLGTNDRHYFADVVINFTRLHPGDFSVESYTRFCLGLEWMILRKPFYKNRKVDKSGFVICIGGTDQGEYSERFYSIISREYPDEPIRVIATDRIGQKRIDANKRRGINLQLNLTAEQMAQQFAESRIAIVSASSVAIEALSQGANVIAGYYVDNQINIYKALSEEKYIWGIEGFDNKEVVDKLIESVRAINVGEKRKLFEANNTLGKYRQLFINLCK